MQEVSPQGWKCWRSDILALPKREVVRVGANWECCQAHSLTNKSIYGLYSLQTVSQSIMYFLGTGQIGGIKSELRG